MDAIHLEMVLEAGEDDMPPIIKELQEKYKPKQLHFHKCKYFER